MKHILLAAFLLIAGSAQAQKTQCKGITQSGKQCARMVADTAQYCYQHNPHAQVCQGITKEGKPCKKLASKGTNYCWMHTK